MTYMRWLISSVNSTAPAGVTANQVRSTVSASGWQAILRDSLATKNTSDKKVETQGRTKQDK